MTSPTTSPPPGLQDIPRPDHVRQALQGLQRQLRLSRQFLRLSIRVHELTPPALGLKQAEATHA